MATKEARQRAVKKYLEGKEDLRIRVDKGEKAVIQSHAESKGESLNSFVVRAIDETMKRDKSSEG